MGRWAQHEPDQFSRLMSDRWWEGVAFFQSREEAKTIAKKVRQVFGAPCRSVMIPKSGGPLGYDDRFLVMLPTGGNDPVELKAITSAIKWIREQEVY